MHKFSDFGIDSLDNKCIFQVPQIQISDVVNCEITVLDYQSNIRTSHGEGRCILKIEHEGKEKKFFTNADPIKSTLEKIPKDKFPFTATIKKQNFGNGRSTFYFT
jgi:hypothetical protein